MWSWQDILNFEIKNHHGSAFTDLPMDVPLYELSLRRWRGKVEGEGLGWFTAEEIHHLDVRPEDRAAINHFFEENGF